MIHEFGTAEQADRYDHWFRATVKAALREADAPGATFIPHDQVMAEINEIIEGA